MNGFIETVQEMRNGATAADLEEALADLVRAVRDTGKGGTITYTLALKPAGKGGGDAFLVADAIKVKAPTLERGTTVFFANRDGLLQRESPRQPQLAGLKVAEEATGELRSPAVDRALEQLRDPDGTGRTRVTQTGLDGKVDVLAEGAQ